MNLNCSPALQLYSLVVQKTLMNITYTMNFILDRSSRRIIRIALPITSSRACSNNHAPAPRSHARLTRTALWVRPLSQRLRSGQLQSIGRRDTSNLQGPFQFPFFLYEVMQYVLEELRLDKSIWWYHYWKRKNSFFASLTLASFNVRMLNQIGYLDVLARILDTYKINAWCLRNAHTRSHLYTRSA